MPTPTKGARLGGSSAHQRHMLANLATALFEHGKITTTEARARRLRPYAERLITFAKRGDLHARRQVMTVIRDKDVVHKLFAEIGPALATREGGYLRIVKQLPRKGDNAPMAIIEIITEETVSTQASRATRAAASRRAASRSKAADVAAPATSEAPAEDDADRDSASEQVVEAGVEAPAEGDVATAAAGEEVVEEVVEESAATDEAPYGAGSHAALADDGEPDGFPIKGNESSKLYHVPGSSHYEQTKAEVWFATAEDAEAAGFALPPSQQESDEDA